MGSTESRSEEVAFLGVGHHAGPPPTVFANKLPRDQSRQCRLEFLNTSGHRIECVVRFAMGGVQVEISSDGSPLVSRVFPNGAEAMAFAEEERGAWSREIE